MTLIAALVWLNGPGLRWLAPMVAARFFEKAGIRGRFLLEGSITGGISVKQLFLETDGTLGTLTVGRVTPVYQFTELAQGKLRGIVIDGLQADLRLGLEKPDAKKKPPLDLEVLVRTLRAARNQVVPLSVELTNIGLNATRDGKPVIKLAPSHLRHAPGEPGFQLSLGTITDANGREWPAQEIHLELDGRRAIARSTRTAARRGRPESRGASA